MAFQSGILPDPVIRDPRAEAAFIFLQLDAGLDATAVQQCLGEISAIVAETEGAHGDRISIALGYGESFFGEPATPRFGLSLERLPHGMRTTLELPGREGLPGADIVLYAVATEEAALADLLKRLSALRGRGLAGAQIERGFQRDDGREVFGNLDGLRNLSHNERFAAVFVDRERFPEEPDWTEDGSYFVYARVNQNLDAWAALDEATREQVIGRRTADGSRLDLPTGSDPRAEGDFAAEPPAADSHVRKVGPRGSHGDVAIFRRGVPFFTLRGDGSPDAGLQFGSFQASLRHFDVVFNEWMLNKDFPRRDAGIDRLFTQSLVEITRAGVFFMPAQDPRFLGAAIFEAPKPDPKPRKEGRVRVRKRAVDTNGSPIRADLDGCVFQVLTTDGTAVGATFETNSAGHAVSEFLPIRQDYLLREVSAPDHLEPSGDVSFRLERRNQIVEVINRLRAESPYGS